MPNNYIPAHLKVSNDDVEENAKLFNDLFDIAMSVIRPQMGRILLRMTAESGAEVWSQASQELLGSLLRDESALDNLNFQQLLSDFLKEDLQAPDEQEIEENTGLLSKLMISAWVEIVDQALGNNMQIVLRSSLLPDNQDDQKRFVRALESYQLVDEQPFAIMYEFAKRLFNGGEKARLPLNITLQTLATSEGAPVLVTAKRSGASGKVAASAYDSEGHVADSVGNPQSLDKVER